MEDNKSTGEETEKKQVKFSENSKQTTYEKDPDVTQTTDDEEVRSMGRSASSRASTTSRTSSGDKIAESSDTGLHKTEISKEIPKELSKENVPTSTFETDEDKLERLGKKYDLDKPEPAVNEMKDNGSGTGSFGKNDDKVQSDNEYKDVTDIQNESSKPVEETTQDTSDTESKKEVKMYQPKTSSFSLNSRGTQNNSSSESSPVKSSLQLPLDQNESHPATPRDIDLAEGLESDRKVDLDTQSTENDPQKSASTEKSEDRTEQQKPREESSELAKEEKTHIKDSNDTITRQDSEKDNENAEKDQQKVVQVVQAKPQVKLDLSNVNGSNTGRVPTKSNGRNDAHIKTDFRKSRPVQTTATKITVPTTQPNSTNAASSRATGNKSAASQRTVSPRQVAAQDRAERQRKAQSARPGGHGNETVRSTSSRASSRSSRPPSRPRSCGYDSERRRNQEFFQAELRRLKQSLGNEAKKFRRPKVRNFYPDVYTSLKPYTKIDEADFLINMPPYGYKEKQSNMDGRKSADKKEAEAEDEELMFTTRSTAIGLCDPWDSLNMDRIVLPKLETAELRQRRMEQMRSTPKPKSPRPKRPEAKQGSTRLPKFPVITLQNQELATKELYYGDVPMIRDELVRNYGHSGETRKKSDYKRTKQDFFRMELDRVNDYHKTSQPHMRAAYYAYLQNTPGSRKALIDCMKEIQAKKEPQTPQAVA